MKVKVLVGALVFLVVLNVAAITTFVVTMQRKPSPPRWGTGRGPGGRGGMDFWRDMDRKDRQQLRDVAHAFQDSTRDLQDRSREMEDQVFELMRQDEVDRARVDSLLQEISEVRLEIGRKAIDNLIETRRFLSPEQQRILHQMILRNGPGRRHAPGLERGRRDRDRP